MSICRSRSGQQDRRTRPQRSRARSCRGREQFAGWCGTILKHCPPPALPVESRAIPAEATSGFLEKLRQLRRRLDEPGLERILEEALDGSARRLRRKHDPFPRLRDQAGVHVSARFGEQLGLDQLLGFLGVLRYPIGEGRVSIREFFYELWLAAQKF